ncbi:MAG: hypothetical protein ABI432_08880 [Flavobacteriales bacterium]
MSKAHVMNVAPCLPLCALMSLSATVPAPPVADDLFELVRKGSITATAKGLGGHEGDCLSLTLINRTGSPLMAEIRPGALMISEDSALQNLMIVRREQVLLPSFGKATVTCRAFCAESSDGGPGMDSPFLVARMAAPLLVALAAHVNEQRYSDGAVQEAVWVLSNGHSVSEVVGDGLTDALPLREFVAGLAGVEVPWYSTFRDRPRSPDRVYSKAPVRVNGEVDFELNTHALVTILIKDARQRTVRVMATTATWAQAGTASRST